MIRSDSLVKYLLFFLGRGHQLLPVLCCLWFQLSVSFQSFCSTIQLSYMCATHCSFWLGLLLCSLFLGAVVCYLGLAKYTQLEKEPAVNGNFTEPPAWASSGHSYLLMLQDSSKPFTCSWRIKVFRSPEMLGISHAFSTTLRLLSRIVGERSRREIAMGLFSTVPFGGISSIFSFVSAIVTCCLMLV